MAKTWRDKLEAKSREREERVNRLGQFCAIVAKDVVRLNIRQGAIERALAEKGVLTKEDYDAIVEQVADEFQKKSEDQTSPSPSSIPAPTLATVWPVCWAGALALVGAPIPTFANTKSRPSRTSCD